jgi:hypothetical protein
LNEKIQTTIPTIARLTTLIKKVLNDKYDKNILIERFQNFKKSYLADCELIKNGLPIRHQNTPEDITENITKFIIRNYEKDKTCVWCKGIDKKYRLTGDLYSENYEQIEVKSFTSDGPSQFGPDKKFSVLYFLDLRNWLDDEIILWKVNLRFDSKEFKKIKVNKKQTLENQLREGRRPRISWDKIKPQIAGYYHQIFRGTFDDIFNSNQMFSAIRLAINETTGTETALPAKLYNLLDDRVSGNK